MGQEEDIGHAFLGVVDPLLKVAVIYANQMRDGTAPVNVEAWALIRQAFHAGFEIPEDAFPNDPRELTEPMNIKPPLGWERMN
jgi:hypothetical protein